MKRYLAADQVIDDIEFELLLDDITRDDLSHSLRLIEQRQHKLRAEAYAGNGRLGPTELLSRSMQVTDMLLVLLHEMIGFQRATRHQIRRLGELAFDDRPASRASDERKAFVDTWVASELDPYIDGWPPEEIERAMDSENMIPELELRAPGVPLIGRLVGRAKAALHNIAVFYVTRSALRQTDANAAFGQWIERLVRETHRQKAMILQLEERLAGLESRVDTPAD